ncbi:MAG: hypothetical protein HQ523_14420 [Lentisphaerae bacterium]|nr:hypothetical protein [Lentisphaerota bacterium]
MGPPPVKATYEPLEGHRSTIAESKALWYSNRLDATKDNMKNSPSLIALLLAVGFCSSVVTTVAEPSPNDAADGETLKVIDVVITATNQFFLGSNAVSLAMITNLLATHRDTLDIVVVHGSIPGGAASDDRSPTLAKIAGMGVPLVIVEKEGEYTWRERTAADGIRTLTLDTSEFAALRRLWKQEGPHAEAASIPTVATTVTWDTATGTYDLSRIELGLLGKRVWLMHEFRESDKPGSVGLQFKQEW